MQPVPWICAAALLIAAPALTRAQEVTGSLEGRVVSAEGPPVQGAVVTASGPFLQGTLRVITDAGGGFRLSALPPGAYELHLAQIGFRPLVIREVAVALGRTTGLEPLVMILQPVEMEPLVVTAQVVTLDPVHTTVGGTLDPSDYAGLPGDRDYKSLLAVLPHANESTRGDAINVAGSTGLENRYFIDGVNVTDPRDASRATSLPYNFVRAVEVKVGGYEAQYGRALGAVVNAITYTGTNAFEANVFGFVQPAALALDPRVAPAITENGAVSYDAGIRVGGPVLRDRLWYSAAVNPRVDQMDKELAGQGFFRDRTTALRFAGKLTWKATASTGLELSVFGDPTTRDGVDGLPNGLTSVASPDALLNRQTSGGVAGSLRATVRLGPGALLEGSVARQWDRYSVEGATPLGRSQPRYEDFVTGVISGGYPLSQHDDRGRTSLSTRATLTLGAHTVVAGAEYEDEVVSWQFSKVGTGIGGWIGRIDTALYVTDYQEVGGTFHNRSPAAYLQDSWQIWPRLVLNAGLRWSGQFLTGASGKVAQRIPDEWQPRAGFSWQVGRLGTQRVFGSYGRVYETLPEFLAAISFVNYPWVTRYYATDPRQPGAVPTSVVDNTVTEAMGSMPVPGLHGDNFDEYSLGYERLFGVSTRLTVRGLYHHLRSAYLVGYDQSLPLPKNWELGTPGQGTFTFLPAPRRDYTALEIAAEGAWKGVRYRASYVLSRSWGNYTGGYSSDYAGSAPQPGQNMALMVPAQAVNSTGLLPNDRTHMFKLSGAYTFPVGLEAGAFLYAASGSPVNKFAPGDWGLGTPTFVVARGSAGRTPALWNLDLRLAYAVPFGRGPGGRVVMDLLHVGNPRGTTRVDEAFYTLLDANGNPTSLNPAWGHAVAYQPPMAVRLGFETTF